MKVSVKFDGVGQEECLSSCLRDGSVWGFEGVERSIFSVNYDGTRAWLKQSSGGRGWRDKPVPKHDPQTCGRYAAYGELCPNCIGYKPSLRAGVREGCQDGVRCTLVSPSVVHNLPSKHYTHGKNADRTNHPHSVPSTLLF